MFKNFTKLHVPRSGDIFKNRNIAGYTNVINKQFSSEIPNESTYSQTKDKCSKHRDAFQGLKTKICVDQNQKNLRKYAMGESFETIKQKLYESLALRKNQSKDSSDAQVFDQSNIQTPYEALKSTPEQKEAESPINEEYSGWNDNNERDVKKEDIKAQPSFSLRERMSFIAFKAPGVEKVVTFFKESWEQTFPKDKFLIKTEQIKKRARETAQRDREGKVDFTEEELSKIQEVIPEWKRTSLVEVNEGREENKSMPKKIMNAFKNKINDTDVAKSVYKSEQFKEYQEFRKEMSQFKEDVKDHLTQSQNPAVIASMQLYSKFTAGSSTARAIQEMRKIVPGFDVFELERDAKGVFCQAYDAFLEGNLEFIEKVCGESALVYFKTLLKKREVDNVCPKYNYLWDSEQADLIGGKIPAESNLPRFTFTIRVQEIHCNLCRKSNMVKDGAEDKVSQNRYNFVLTLHETPDFETTGHPWEIVEILPVETVQMLA